MRPFDSFPALTPTESTLVQPPPHVPLHLAQGMFWEASGNLERAEDLYTEVLQENPSNEMIAKRLVRAGWGH